MGRMTRFTTTDPSSVRQSKASVLSVTARGPVLVFKAGSLWVNTTGGAAPDHGRVDGQDKRGRPHRQQTG